jgi:hypothetical protein
MKQRHPSTPGCSARSRRRASRAGRYRSASSCSVAWARRHATAAVLAVSSSLHCKVTTDSDELWQQSRNPRAPSRYAVLHTAIVGRARSMDTVGAGGWSPVQKISSADRSPAVAGPAVGPARHGGACLFAPEVRSRRPARHHHHPALRPVCFVRTAPHHGERLVLHPGAARAPVSRRRSRQHRLLRRPPSASSFSLARSSSDLLKR